MTAPTPPTSTLVRPFTVSIPDSEIDDMKQRLARTRWPDPETVGDYWENKSATVAGGNENRRSSRTSAASAAKSRRSIAST
jgi:hypothetical protein